jgi:hypothetical protein
MRTRRFLKIYIYYLLIYISDLGMIDIDIDSIIDICIRY